MDLRHRNMKKNNKEKIIQMQHLFKIAKVDLIRYKQKTKE